LQAARLAEADAQMQSLRQGLVRVAPTVAAAAAAKREIVALHAALRTQAMQLRGDLAAAMAAAQRELVGRLASQQEAVAALHGRLRREMGERKRLHNLVQELRGNIRVFCRVRPPLPFELEGGSGVCVSFPEQGEVTVVNNKRQVKTWEFDQVFVPSVANDVVFKETEPLVVSTMDGYNVCIFACEWRGERAGTVAYVCAEPCWRGTGWQRSNHGLRALPGYVSTFVPFRHPPSLSLDLQTARRAPARPSPWKATRRAAA
jgi:hypothetical protein